jgi:hypothetical protein
MTERPRPRFRGVTTYLDPLGRFTVRYPTDWYQFKLEEERDGVMFSPEANNPQTWFSIWSSELAETAVAEDLDLLRDGIDEGLAQLPECTIESASEAVYDNLLKFERIYTFRDGDAIRKRKVWLLYVAKWLIVLTWQGSSVEEYHYWLSMGNYSFATFTLPPELWFATDRNLNATA